MTDQMIPADKVRDLHRDAASGASPEDVEAAREWAGDVLEGRAAAIVPFEEAIARVLRDYLPPPPRPTLADMTDEERAECQWMQADVTSRSGHYVVATPHDDGDDAAVLIDPDGEADWVSLEYVTPRPDLPRLEWSDKNPDPAPTLPDGWRFADHEKHGRVIVTNPTPDCYGTVYFAFPRVDCLNGFDWKFCDPDELTYLD